MTMITRTLFRCAGLLLEDMRRESGISENQLMIALHMSKHTYNYIKKGRHVA